MSVKYIFEENSSSKKKKTNLLSALKIFISFDLIKIYLKERITTMQTLL